MCGAGLEVTCLVFRICCYEPGRCGDCYDVGVVVVKMRDRGCQKVVVSSSCSSNAVQLSESGCWSGWDFCTDVVVPCITKSRAVLVHRVEGSSRAYGCPVGIVCWMPYLV